MLIERYSASIKFGDIERGEVFEFDGGVFLKVRDYFDINAVELKTGNLFNINPDQEVIIFNNAKVVIK